MKNIFLVYFLILTPILFAIKDVEEKRSTFEGLPEDMRFEICKHLTMHSLLLLFSLNKNLYSQFPKRFTQWHRENKFFFVINILKKKDIKKLKWLNQLVEKPVLKIRLLNVGNKLKQPLDFLNVISLNFGFSFLFPDEVENFLSDKNFKNLTYLDMSNFSTMGTKAVLKLSESNYIKNLTFLSLSKVEDRHIKFLAESENFKNLTSLKLDGFFSDKGLKMLSKSFYIKKLKLLDLWTDKEVGDSIIEIIVEGSNFKGLNSLSIINRAISDMGIKLLVDSDIINNLVYLYLRSKNLTDEGIKALTKLKALSKLKKCWDLKDY